MNGLKYQEKIYPFFYKPEKAFPLKINFRDENLGIPQSWFDGAEEFEIFDT